eukprot:s907_g14.t1
MFCFFARDAFAYFAEVCLFSLFCQSFSNAGYCIIVQWNAHLPTFANSFQEPTAVSCAFETQLEISSSISSTSQRRAENWPITFGETMLEDAWTGRGKFDS